MRIQASVTRGNGRALPPIVHAANMDALRAVAQTACGMLDAVQCACLLPPAADARAAAQEILLGDAVPAGAA